MNLEVAGSSPAEIATTNHSKSVSIIFTNRSHTKYSDFFVNNILIYNGYFFRFVRKIR